MTTRHYDRERFTAPAQTEWDGHCLTVHASQLGGCPRILVAGALGYVGKTPPAYQANLFQSGHQDEATKKKQLRGWNVTIEDEQRQIELHLGSVRVIGAIDGIASLNHNSSVLTWPNADASILELKSMSDQQFQQWKKKGLQSHRQYAVQISCYMYALELPAVYVVSRRTDAPTVNDYQVTYLETPPISLEELQQTARQLLECIHNNNGLTGQEAWPPCPSKKPRWCQYEYLHDKVRAVDGLDDRLADDLDVSASHNEALEEVEDALETRRTLREAKRIARSNVNREMIVNLHRDNLSQIVPMIPPIGTSVHVVCNASADFWQFCPHLLKLIGPAHLHASTWSMNRDNALELLDLLDQRQLLSASILTGSYFKTREGAVYATLAEGLLARNQRLLAFWNHSKIMVIYNDRAAITIEGSANFTMNPRVEQYVISHDRALQEFHVNWMEEMFIDAGQRRRQ